MKARHRNLGFLLIILLIQAWVVFQASWIHYKDDTRTQHKTPHHNMQQTSKQTTTTTTTVTATKKSPASTSSSTSTFTHHPPRILVGIFSSIFYPMARVFRWRHRQLMQLYDEHVHHPPTTTTSTSATNNHTHSANKSKNFICSIAHVHEDCQVIYAFVLGASASLENNNATISTDSYSTGSLPTQQLDPTLSTNQLAMSFDQWQQLQQQQQPQQQDVNYDANAFRDLIHATVQDAIVLNITENMNQGKTPTFFHWASTWVQEHADTIPVDYIVKCDADAMVRIPGMLQFVQKELTTTTTTTTVSRDHHHHHQGLVPTMVGAFRHKALWNQSRFGALDTNTPPEQRPNQHPEAFWLQNYHHGTHLYMAGQWYLVSVDLAQAMVQEARRLETLAQSPGAMYTLGNAHTYMEGHEDHDATSMIQVGAVGAPIRWICMPRHYRFWEHPVKGDMWWKRIWKREQRKQAERLERNNHTSSSSTSTGEYEDGNGVVVQEKETKVGRHRPSLVILLGATTAQNRDDYRALWRRTIQEQGDGDVKLCTLSQYVDGTTTANTEWQAVSSCDLVYVFVAGSGTVRDPTEALHKVVATRGLDHEQDDTYLFPNIQDNVHHGMGTTVLTWLEESSNWLDLFSFVVWVTARHHLPDEMVKRTFSTQHTLLHVSSWLSVESIHASDDHPHASLIGDLRDRYQEPLEFPDHNAKNDTYWWVEYENIHLYMGSDCWALGTSLVPGILEVARENPEARAYGLGNLGHDLTTYAYFVPKTWLHWIPIPTPLRFWTTAEEEEGGNQ